MDFTDTEYTQSLCLTKNGKYFKKKYSKGYVISHHF